MCVQEILPPIEASRQPPNRVQMEPKVFMSMLKGVFAIADMTGDDVVGGSELASLITQVHALTAFGALHTNALHSILLPGPERVENGHNGRARARCGGEMLCTSGSQVWLCGYGHVSDSDSLRCVWSSIDLM